MKFSILIGGERQAPPRITQAAIKEEALLMEILSDELKAAIPDDDAIEIDVYSVYRD
jgi:hypothetical protein